MLNVAANIDQHIRRLRVNKNIIISLFLIRPKYVIKQCYIVF